MMKYTNEATKQSADSGVASVDPGVCRVGSAREAFRSTSSRAMGRESSRGARPSTRGVGPRKDPIKSSKHSPILNPNGDGAGNTVGNIDLTKVKGNVCLTCGARARSVVVGEGRRTRHERSAAIILVEVTRFAMGGGGSGKHKYQPGCLACNLGWQLGFDPPVWKVSPRTRGGLGHDLVGSGVSFRRQNRAQGREAAVGRSFDGWRFT